jgi:chromate transport protein ChrA
VNSDHIKIATDVGSVGMLLATLAGWLPSVAALFTIIWTAIRIYESPTVQRLLGKDP